MKRILTIAAAILAMAFSNTFAETPLQPDVQSLHREIVEMKKALARFESLARDQGQRIATLEKGNEELRSKLAEQQAGPVAQRIPPTVPVELAKAKAGIFGSGVFTPEIGVVGDMVATSSEQSLDREGNDRIAVRELELVFGSYIDPYSRFDVTTTVADFEDFGIEEAYITHYGLPWEIKAEVGRFRPKIGKASAMHRDSLDTVDEPLVVRRYFGSEGYFRSGADLSKVFELPWDLTGEATLGILEGGVGEGGTAFGSTRRRPTLFSHLKTYKDISDVSNIEIGATHMVGSKDADERFEVNALGLDATWTYFVTPSNKFKWQSEAYFQNRKESFQISTEGNRTLFSQYPWGFYSLMDYRLTPRWEIGARVDAVEPVDNLAGNRLFETGWTGFLTYHQSEFARWRAQFSHTDFAAGGDDNTIFFQGTVAIGQHKHKLQ